MHHMVVTILLDQTHASNYNITVPNTCQFSCPSMTKDTKVLCSTHFNFIYQLLAALDSFKIRDHVMILSIAAWIICYPCSWTTNCQWNFSPPANWLTAILHMAKLYSQRQPCFFRGQIFLVKNRYHKTNSDPPVKCYCV